MKKFILIILLLGVLFMLKPVSAIIKDSISNIMYRGNVVTGTVAVVNGDGSYDVFISESDRAYPKIFTLSANPNLAVGDKVRILYKGGCKELPIILPPTTAAVTTYRGYALITAYPNNYQLFDMDGALLKTTDNAGFGYGNCGITMDSQGNIYVEEAGEVIKKYDSNLNLLVTQNIENPNNWISAIKIGNDGYLYTLENLSTGFDVKKRSTSDLTIQETISLAGGVSDYAGGSFCLDSNGNFYIDNDGRGYIEKYNSSGTKTAELIMGYMSDWAGFAIVGSTLYMAKYIDEIYYLPLDLSGYTAWELPDSFAYCLTAADGYLIMSGWDADGDGATTKYDSGRNLIWQKKLPGTTYGYKAGAYNF